MKKFTVRRLLTITFLTGVVGIVPAVSLSYEECPGEYYIPCSCRDSHRVWGTFFWAVVECNNISFEEVQTVFKQISKAVDIPRLAITLNENDEDVVPADLTGETRVEEITLNCLLTNLKHNLKVDENAFRSSRSFTKAIIIENCNTSQLDFGFLTGFHDLTKLIIRNSSNLHQSFRTLPPLNCLTQLELEYSSFGLDQQLTHYPTLTNGLKEFYLKISPDSKMKKQPESDRNRSVYRILSWILPSSAESLEKLTLNGMGLTTIPKEINSFKNLKEFDLDYNTISLIQTSWLNLPHLRVLSLAFNRLTTIEAGAFKDIYRGASLDLRYNNLTRFEASVFLPELRQRETLKEGIIYMEYNQFSCDQLCQLGWIIRDNRDLLKYIDYARCYNGTDFKDLLPSELKHC